MALAAAVLVPAEGASARRPCKADPASCGWPTAHIEGVPKRCSAEDFTARVRVPGEKPIRRMTIRLDSHTVAVGRDRRRNVPIACSRLAPGRHELTVFVKDEFKRVAVTHAAFDVVAAAADASAKLR